MTRNEAIEIIGEYGTRFLKKDLPVKELPDFEKFKAALHELQGKEERTAKPCHGCGQALQYPKRRTDRVCAECQRKLDNYEALVKARERKGEAEYEVPSRDYGWPYIHWVGQLHDGNRDDGPNEGFRKWLWTVAGLLGRPTVPGFIRPNGRGADNAVKKLPARFEGQLSAGDRSWYDRENIRLMTKAEAEAIDELDLAARRMIRAVYAQGVKDGQDLLKQIASGEMTVADFNREALRRQGVK